MVRSSKGGTGTAAHSMQSQGLGSSSVPAENQHLLLCLHPLLVLVLATQSLHAAAGSTAAGLPDGCIPVGCIPVGCIPAARWGCILMGCIPMGCNLLGCIPMGYILVGCILVGFILPGFILLYVRLWQTGGDVVLQDFSFQPQKAGCCQKSALGVSPARVPPRRQQERCPDEPKFSPSL